jgi:hypothetical protein
VHPQEPPNPSIALRLILSPCLIFTSDGRRW